jgi:hypothetical protein
MMIMRAYLDLPVAVEQKLEFKALLALIADSHDGLQGALTQGHAVDEAKVQGPRLARILTQSRFVEAKVEFDRVCF